MSEEEMEAIDRAKKQLGETTYITDIGHRDLETILNLIEKQQAEIRNLKQALNEEWEDWNNLEQSSYEIEKNLKTKLEKKDKIVDEMAEQLAGLAIFDMEKDEPIILGDKEEVINYFKMKVEEKKNDN